MAVPFKNENDALFRRLSECPNDTENRNAIVLKYLPWLHAQANKAMKKATNQRLDEMVNVGVLGMLRCLKTFKPEFGTSFTKYAEKYVFKLMRNGGETRGIGLRIQRSRLLHKLAQLNHQAGRRLTISEQAVALGIGEAEIDGIMRRLNCTQSCSIDSKEGLNLESKPRPDASDMELQRDVMNVVLQLPGTQRELIQALFFDGLSQEEYAEKIGLSRQAVFQKKEVVLHRIRLDLAQSRVRVGL